MAPRWGRLAFSFVLYAIIGAFAISILVPLFWIVTTSLKPLVEAVIRPIRWIPSEWQWSNYIEAWNALPFARFFMNSLIVTGFVTVGQVLFCTMAGYGFAKFNFPAKEGLFAFVLSTMMLPVQVIMVPLFILVATLGWQNTYQGLIIPVMINAFGVFYMRQYVRAIPNEYIDAARIDGASEFRIFIQVVMPLAVPGMVGLGLLSALVSWDELLWPLIVATDRSFFTVPVGIAMFTGNYWTPPTWILAISVLACLPMLILFILGQRHLVESGVLSGIR